jgi:phosphoribosylamine---glycine ligase
VCALVKILVIGSGAREHALVRALLRGGDEVFAAPGNAGISRDVPTRPVDVSDTTAIADTALDLAVDLVVIGPEVPLVAGAADELRARGIACFGPSEEAARLEGSKAFAKEIMAAAGVPTAMARVCTDLEHVDAALDGFGAPYVVKDGDAARAHAAACLARGGDAAVVIEEYLDGPEVSLFAITDGVTVLPLEPAQDFKRVGDGDAGPNTGGMGAYSPLPWASADLVDDVLTRVLQPTVDEMRALGHPFTGLLYAGLALTRRGLRVVEFNARFGDPETQVVLARLRTPLGPLLYAAATGTLATAEPPEFTEEAAVVVVIAAEGYPGSVASGDAITGLDAAADVTGADILHAGTGVDSDGRLVSAGGRVLSVVGTGSDLADARASAYAAVRLIDLRGSHHRRDIAELAAEGTGS